MVGLLVFNKYRTPALILLAMIFQAIYCTRERQTCCEAGTQSRESPDFSEIVWLPKAKRYPSLEFTSFDLNGLISWWVILHILQFQSNQSSSAFLTDRKYPRN